MRDEARGVIEKLEAAGCVPEMFVDYKGWVEMHRPVDIVESYVLSCSVVEYERATPTGMRPIRAWSWCLARFGNTDHQRVEAIVQGIPR